jgi:hypothetical protein
MLSATSGIAQGPSSKEFLEQRAITAAILGHADRQRERNAACRFPRRQGHLQRCCILVEAIGLDESNDDTQRVCPLRLFQLQHQTGAGRRGNPAGG